MLERLQQSHRARIAAAALDADHTLGYGRQTQLGIQPRGDARLQAQTDQPGTGQHDGIHAAGIQLANPRVHIAAQGFDAQIRPQGTQLRLAPQARGAHHRAPRQILQACDAGCGQQRVPRVRPFQNRRNEQARRKLGGHILHRMHRDIGAQFLDCDLEFLYK